MIERQINSVEIGRRIVDLLDQLLARIPSAAPPAPARIGPVALARRLYRMRRRRESIFGDHLFGEPAWDILLDLYLAKADGRSISVSSACIGAAVPSTTALRWLGALEQEGLIRRERPGRDRRRTDVVLTDLGFMLVDRALSDMLDMHGE